MSHYRDIALKIRSIQNTAKITKAMQMVAASKMRRTQQQMRDAQPYADLAKQMMVNLMYAFPEYRDAFLQIRPVKSQAIIVISTDRGLCGGLNLNLFKMVMHQIEESQHQNQKMILVTLGGKAKSFFHRVQMPIWAESGLQGEKPEPKTLIRIVRGLLHHYQQGQLDSITIASNHFVNAMSQQPILTPFLPLPKSQQATASLDYLFEPDAKFVIEALIKRYLESQLYRAVVENMACEQAARMMAMQAASDNANQLIKDLRLVYNKVRQASITQEITEIVSGAAAIAT